MNQCVVAGRVVSGECEITAVSNALAATDPLRCNCGDGYTSRDRSCGDYTELVVETCDKCDGTTRLKCAECDAPAIRIDEWDGEPVCAEHTCEGR